MTKQKTRQELEWSIWKARYFAIVFSVLFLVALTGLIFFGIKSDSFQEQLSECQEQVPFWVLEYKCEVVSDRFEENLYFVTKTEYYHLEFNDYQLYQDAKERFEKRDLKNCEVLK